MSLPYFARLLCLCLASFLLVNMAAGIAVAILANAASKLARRMPPQHGACLLFALRACPALFAIALVGFVCVPSYIWMEPQAIDEPVGWLCLIAAALAILGWIQSASRAAHAVLRSRRYLEACGTSIQILAIAGERVSATILERRDPLFAVAGILRPRLIISECAVEAFSREELACAVRHEQAHRNAGDNLKRFLMLLMPDTLPFVRTMQHIERAWAELAEWTADDRATLGNPRNAVALASALVRAARMTSASSNAAGAPALVTALLTNSADLSLRVDRLLENIEPPRPLRIPRIGAAALTLACMAVSAMFYLPVLSFAHELFEHLVH